MNTNLQQASAYQLNDYKIILLPHKELVQQILKIKKAFIEKMNLHNTIALMPQIILANFKQAKAIEKSIINRLRIIAMASQPFRVQLKDFGNFHPHTIFLNVANKETINNLVKKIKTDAIRLIKFGNDSTPQFMSEAHLTIAGKLKAEEFEKAWTTYSHKHFTGKFIASRMLLLRKAPGELKYMPIESFEFMNLPVEVKQGELF